MKSIFKRTYKTNEYLVLLMRFGLAMALFSVSRIAFYLFNADLFENINTATFLTLLKGGVRFDLSALLYLNSLYILVFLLPFRFKFIAGVQTGLKWLFFITNGIGLAANVADIIYYRFTLKRTTASVFEIFENEENMFSLWGQFLVDYWYVVLLWGGVVAIMVWGYNRFKAVPFPIKTWWKYSLVGTVFFVLAIGLTIGGMRGGFEHSTRPINISNAARYVERPEQISIVLNTPFAVLRTFDKSVFKPVRYFSEKRLAGIYSPVFESRKSASSLSPDSQTQRPNIVMIILESFGREHIGALNKDLENGRYKGYTPFLDSLIQESWAFDNAYANGRKSIDALPSIIASVPSLVQPYIVSEYATNEINGLPGLLDKVGYESAFYHGAPNGSMGFLAFTKMAGYDQYIGKTEYNNDDDFDGMWGIWDEPFFQFFANDMERLKPPFFSTIFSLSSHHPFAVPERYEGVFPEGPLPLHKSMGYTDMALKRFFETASQYSWFSNTLFIITADHCTVPFHKEYKTPVESFAVPILFYKPGDISPKMDHGLAQQTDILPTVLSYIDYPYPFVSFGNDLFAVNPGERFVANYFNESYQFLFKDYVLYFDGKRTTGIYNLEKDPLQKSNLVGKMDLPEGKMLMKAYIQQYITRMRQDKLAQKEL
ncbi:LTA synthase family protein [Marinilabilia rubra]|uniref:Sulfatase n=1 Tax=Marinilabilia rubra TaxID=2162893 RepID=A0A2U2BC59_9BACT|nr:LTA synthase family protein [Marinilabilia rubra]PWE00641.1 sulfatase [Marinilabilia rubra]